MKKFLLAIPLMMSCLIAGCSSTPANELPDGYQKPSDNTDNPSGNEPVQGDFVVFGYAQPAQWN